MEQVLAFFQNRILMNGLIAWAVAQVLKTIIFTILNHRFDISRLFGDGGMPSGHSATVTAMAVSSGIIYGLGSFEFAVTAILAIIVMHDAMGVRLETGKQAKMINDIVELLLNQNQKLTQEEQLKELVGHTPLQVFFGGLLGVLVAVICCLVV